MPLFIDLTEEKQAEMKALCPELRDMQLDFYAFEENEEIIVRCAVDSASPIQWFDRENPERGWIGTPYQRASCGPRTLLGMVTEWLDNI